MAQKRLSKYFLYAIGEIILVVIGILIALQINNWNESKKTSQIGYGYLQRIHSDLVKDSINLREKELFAQNERKSYETYIQSMYIEKINTKQFVEFISLVVWDSENLILEDKTYDEITNSGKFSYIENQKLRDQIMDYYREYYVIDEHISEMNQTGINMFADSYKRIIKYYDVWKPILDTEIMYNKSDWEFINDKNSNEFRELESAALFYYWKQHVFEEYYRTLLTKGNNLIKEINSEIALNN